MTPDQVQNFINDLMDKKIDTDRFPKDQPYQCVDVIRAYMAGRILNFPDLATKYAKGVIQMPMVNGNAVDYWYQFPTNPILQQYFTRIVNYWWVVPKFGDIAIFAGTKTNPYGHIGIVSRAANLLWMTVFEQNDPFNSPCHYKAYNYRTPPVLGFLRPKQLVVATANVEVAPKAA
jgi:hypothetical protein